MSRKKTLVRNLLFAALILAAGLVCTGCCTLSVIRNLGTTRTNFSEYRYEMSPLFTKRLHGLRSKTMRNASR